jgi:threonine dehydrogenase-like Zn-dependent dehydrogenase
MRAVVFRSEGVVETDDVADPSISAPTDAIVRVLRAGICGSDLHFFHGKAPMDAGTVMGHEAVGIVEEVGSGVASRRVGERVVTSFHIACGSCWFCRSGQSGLCEEHAILGGGPFGGDLAGTQAQFVRIPRADVNLLPVDDRLDDERALFLGDVATTGMWAARLSGAAPGDVVAVVGAGPVGLCTAMALAAAGVDAFVVDRDPLRLTLAGRIGAATIDLTHANPEMVLSRASDGRGADVVIDAVGAPDAYLASLEMVRRGGRVVVVGMYAAETVEFQLGVAWVRGLDLRFAGETPVHTLWRDAMAAMAEGDLDPQPLVSHRLPIGSAPEGYAAFDRRAATKVVLDPWA